MLLRRDHEPELNIVSVFPVNLLTVWCISFLDHMTRSSASWFLIDPPPHIITHSTDASAAVPFSGVFTCSAGGYGRLYIIWYRNGKQVPNKSIISQAKKLNSVASTLTVSNVTDDDVGKYYCEAWANGKAVRSMNVTLYKLGTCIQYVHSLSINFESPISVKI